MEMIHLNNINHVVLDIEGTTCPIQFVAETLFPYASQHLDAYIRAHQHEGGLQTLLLEIRDHWQNSNPNDMAFSCQAEIPGKAELQANWQLITPYIKWLIDSDLKLTSLKDLQGLIWEDGYAKGKLKGPLFEDVAPALRLWQQQGTTLSVYSSGSVRAQQLLYGHSTAGNLIGLFHHWFDTRIGSKQSAASYMQIAASINARPEQVLFISDSIPELQAASAAGMCVLFSNRPGNPEVPICPWPTITTFEALDLSNPNLAATQPQSTDSGQC
jgi:enolase-phosphatase E1